MKVLIVGMALIASALSHVSFAAAAPREWIPNKDCLECHSDKDLTKTNATGQVTHLFVDASKLAASIHAKTLCSQCHSDLTAKHPDDDVPAKPVSCAACHENQSASYAASVHADALRHGDASAATCKDCHGNHEILPPSSPASPLHPSNLAKTCGECHEQAAKEVQQSVHGVAMAKGNSDAPTCTDCHSEHRIEKLKNGSPVRLAEQVCGKCHASERLNTKYKLPADRVRTFFESYHGLAAQYGSTSAANCASCHGVHNILASTNPLSSIHKDHLVETCGKCHPGATANFALSKIHVDPASGKDLGTTVSRWVRRLYLGLIFGVVAALSLHNFLAWGRKAMVSLRDGGRTVSRMDRSQRVQHMILVVSFIVLAWTGFALKYPDSWLAWSLGGSEPVRRWVHRVAGAALLLVGLYHLAYVIRDPAGRRLMLDLLPTWKDLKDVLTNVRYLRGRSSEKARFGRFGYPEKLEYWAVLWGTLIMGGTGLMIWFKIDATRWAPRWILEVATTIHYYEAILACLAILVWHFYHVIFDPAVYPMNWAWFDGKVTSHWMKEEHPLAVPAPANPVPEIKPETIAESSAQDAPMLE